MSKSDSKSSAKSPDTASSSPPRVAKLGELFKRKRRKNEWRKEDVAKTLLLSVEQIEALENDEYDKLPGITYVVGYWHSYAKLLNIDISESIEFYKSNLVASPLVITLEANHRRAHGHQEKSRKRAGLVFIILSVIFLIGMWYWQNPGDNPLNQWFGNHVNRHAGPLPKTGIDDGNQAINGEGISVSVPESEQPSFDVLPEPNFFDDLADTDTDIEEKSISGTAASVQQWQQAAQQIPIAPKQENESHQPLNEPITESVVETPLTEPITESVVETPLTEPITESVVETPAKGSPNWLFLNVEKKSWIDVRDVVGEKLIYRIANEGESIALKGSPPFYVFIESVDGVQIKYLGKAFPFEADEDSIYARFRVGQLEGEANDR